MLMKILFALIALTVIVPVALYYKSGKTKGKECLLMNAISFFSILAVSYTHLTLPTNREVQISVEPVSLKKKKQTDGIGAGRDK